MTTIGVLHIRFRLPAETLKEKRSIVKSVLERIRSRYNAAAAEVDDLDTPSLATLAIVCVSNRDGHADSQLQAIANAVAGWRLDAEILDLETELVHA
ncbi:MAG: hypothetical protein Kow0010_24720 [Dehalococcoidia bacterium]